MSPTPISVSDSDILFLHDYRVFSSDLIRLDNREFKHVTKWISPRYSKTLVKSTCDGVVLLTVEPDSYALWNPTTGTSSLLPCPYSFRCPTREAICFDPVENDLKIVLVAWGHYTVYSSNNKSWTNNGKPAPLCFYERAQTGLPVSVDGAVYWAENLSREIVRFDPTRNEFGSVRMPEGVDGEFRLVCFWGSLCLWSWLGGTERRARFWKKGKGKDVNSWEEMMTIENIEMMSRARKTFEPLCLVGGDEIAIRLDKGVIVVYSRREDTFEEISYKCMILTDWIALVPYAVKGSLNKVDESNALVPNVQSDDQHVSESRYTRMRTSIIWWFKKFFRVNKEHEL